MGPFLFLLQVLDYLEGNRNSRSFTEGEAIANAGHVIACGFTSKFNQAMKIFALVLKTNAMKKEPHEINGLLEFKSNVEALSFCCRYHRRNFNEEHHLNNVVIIDGNNIVNAIVGTSAQSVIMLQLSNMCQKIENNCKSFWENQCQENIYEICCNTLHNKEEWHQARQFKVIGSRCYSLYTYGERKNVD